MLSWWHKTQFSRDEAVFLCHLLSNSNFKKLFKFLNEIFDLERREFYEQNCLLHFQNSKNLKSFERIIKDFHFEKNDHRGL